MIQVVPQFPLAAALSHSREQLEVTLRGWLEAGRFVAGQQLPTPREIARLVGGANEQTVRRALKRLIDEGLLRGAQGKGVFVVPTSAKHGRVALVLPNLEDETTRLIAAGVQSVFDAQGVQTLILDARRDCEQERDHLAALSDLPVDGAIIFPVAYGDISERILRLKVAEFPLVLVDKYCPGIEVDCVLADDFQGAYDLTTALVNRGYRRIAWLGGEEGSTTVENRLDGYRWALGDCGLPVERALVRRLKLATPMSAYRQALVGEVDALLAMENRPDALVCANDLLAVEALEYVQDRGLRVPDDLAVTGFDDLKAAEQATPSLTSVRKPIGEMGVKAAEILLRRITQKHAPASRAVLKTTVIARASTRQHAPATNA